MPCDISRSRTQECKSAQGGLRNLYLINFNDANLDITYDGTNTDVITLIGSATTDADAYKYAIAKSGSSFEETITTSRENGTTYIEQVLSVTLTGLTKEDHKELKLLAYTRVLVLVEDNIGNLFLAGVENGMDVTGGTVAHGAAFGDLSGYTLTLTGMEKAPANFCIPATGTTVAEKIAALNVTVN